MQNRVSNKKETSGLTVGCIERETSGHSQSMLDCPLSTYINPFGMSEVFVVMVSVSFCLSFVLLVSFWYTRSLRAGIAQSV